MKSCQNFSSILYYYQTFSKGCFLLEDYRVKVRTHIGPDFGGKKKSIAESSTFKTHIWNKYRQWKNLYLLWMARSEVFDLNLHSEPGLPYLNLKCIFFFILSSVRWKGLKLDAGRMPSRKIIESGWIIYLSIYLIQKHRQGVWMLSCNLQNKKIRNAGAHFNAHLCDVCHWSSS